MADRLKKRKLQAHTAFAGSVLGTRSLSGNAAVRLLHIVNDLELPEYTTSLSTNKKMTASLANKIIEEHCIEVNAPMLDGESELTLRFVQPAAILRSMCKANSTFGQAIRHVLLAEAGVLRMVVYHDEIVPRNVLKTDNSLKCTAMYVSFLGLPTHMLHNELCWAPAGIIMAGNNAKLDGGLSAWVRYFVNAILPNLKFATAIQCSSEHILPAKLSFKMFLFDESALKMTADSKGASGMKPCSLKCKNVISKLKKAEEACEMDDYLVSIAESDPERFDLMTDEDVWEAVDLLADQSGVLNLTNMSSLQTRMGMNHNPRGLLQDKDLRVYIQPSTFCYDPGHVYYSNGIVPWEIGWYINSLKEEFPEILQKLLQYLSDDRWRMHSGIHISIRSLANPKLFKDDYKGNASESMSLLPYLACFAAEVVLPKGRCRAESKSIIALHQVCREHRRLKHAQQPVRDASCLRLLQHEYFELFKDAYGPESAKPKHHFQFHIPDQVEQHALTLDTLVCERKHAVFKSGVAPFVNKNSQFEKSVLARLLAIQLKELGETNLEDGLLGKKVAATEMEKRALSARDCTLSRALSCQGLNLAVGDIVTFPSMEAAAQVRCCLQCDGRLEVLLTPAAKELGLRSSSLFAQSFMFGVLELCSLWRYIIATEAACKEEQVDELRCVWKLCANELLVMAAHDLRAAWLICCDLYMFGP